MQKSFGFYTLSLFYVVKKHLPLIMRIFLGRESKKANKIRRSKLYHPDATSEQTRMVLGLSFYKLERGNSGQNPFAYKRQLWYNINYGYFRHYPIFKRF